jgi:hypothetical protein
VHGGTSLKEAVSKGLDMDFRLTIIYYQNSLVGVWVE